MYWLITTGITRPNVRQNPNMWRELNHVNDKRKQVRDMCAHMWVSAALQSRGEAHRLYPCFVWGMGMLWVIFNIEAENYYSKSTLLRL